MNNAFIIGSHLAPPPASFVGRYRYGDVCTGQEEFIGGLIIALLYGVVGFLGAIGSILIFRRMFTGRWEQIFWASFLVVIAGFYLSFAAYFQTSIDAWHTELAGVTFFLICAVAGLYSRPILATGYVLHGLWDLVHGLAGTSLGSQSLTQIPLGYDIFCGTYDVTVACYLMMSDTAWHAPGQFNPLFWRYHA